MNPLELLRDRRGRLLEVQILIAFAGAALAVGIGARSWWKGPVYAALGFAAVFAVLLSVSWALDRLEAAPLARRVLDSRFAGMLGAACGYAFGAAGGAATAAFVAIFTAQRFAGTPAGQLLHMRAAAALGAALGLALAHRARSRPASF